MANLVQLLTVFPSKLIQMVGIDALMKDFQRVKKIIVLSLKIKIRKSQNWTKLALLSKP